MNGEIMKIKSSKGKRLGYLFLIGVIGMTLWMLWQFNTGKQLAVQLTTQAEQRAQENIDAVGANSGDRSLAAGKPGQEGGSLDISEGSKSSNVKSPLNSPDQQGTPISEVKNPSGTANSGAGKITMSYKEVVASTYSNTLQTMEQVKANTLALQNRKISLSGYKASIVQSRQDFSNYENFLLNNPPSDPKFKSSYLEFLSGVKLARESMDVVLQGISSLNPSSLYAARDMGKTARDKVVNAYKNF